VDEFHVFFWGGYAALAFSVGMAIKSLWLLPTHSRGFSWGGEFEIYMKWYRLSISLL
jgi:hypothetical protein